MAQQQTARAYPLEPFELRSLTDGRECLLENVVCRWLERNSDLFVVENAAAGAGTAASAVSPEWAALAGRFPFLSPSREGYALLYVHDFSLLHAAAMFGEASMLADHFELRMAPKATDANSDAVATLSGEGTSTPNGPPIPTAADALRSVHTLWIVTGLADFWRGDGDGEHYTCVAMRATNTKNNSNNGGGGTDGGAVRPSLSIPSLAPSAAASPNSMGGAGRSAAGVYPRCDSGLHGLTPSPSHPTPNTLGPAGSQTAFPFVPSDTTVMVHAEPPVAAGEAAEGGNGCALEAFLFDSSAEKSVGLASRLVHLVASAMAAAPSLKDWCAEASSSSSAGGAVDAGAEWAGRVPMWAWWQSPRQQSAVGCGVFMCGHLEALARLWAEGVAESQSSAKPPTLEDLAASIRLHHQLRPTLVLHGAAVVGDAVSQAAPVSPPASPAASDAGARYLALFHGPHGNSGAAFELSYRAYMAKALGH